jgi:hypothetical protein
VSSACIFGLLTGENPARKNVFFREFAALVAETVRPEEVVLLKSTGMHNICQQIFTLFYINVIGYLSG